MTVNSAALALAGYSRDSDVVGLVKDADGQPTGELREFAAMFPVMRRLEIDFGDLGNSARAMDRYARLAVQAGVTTITDLLNDLPESAVAMMRGFTARGDCPIRLVPALNALGGTPEEIADRALVLSPTSTDRLRFGAVKVMTDGSIQGFTAQLKAPGYHRGTGDPIWNIAPEQLVHLVDVLHGRGVQMHIHTNGDLASELAIDALERAVAAHPKWDHRHTLQHFQMADAVQIRRLAAIGGAANLFANHLYYFGDQHHDITLGPQRAARLNPCGTAIAAGLPIAIHSDTPVTPLAPLVTASCAVNRTTETGRVLGGGECIAVGEALRAITLGAAWTLKLDHEVGSIRPGKRADFAVLAKDPLTAAPAELGSIEVLGTVCGGRHFS
jgi:predicted amidohydrolase YtcJ